MKLSVLQENFAKGLAITSRSVASRAQLPVLSNILLKTDRGKLKLSATNLETGISYWIGAKIEKEGAISIPAKTLTEFVSSLPAEKVEMSLEGTQLRISCGSYQANLVGLSANEFPAVPSDTGKSEILFDSDEFCLAVSQVAFAAAQDEGNPVLAGVLLLAKEDGLFLVATDGYRLSLKKIKVAKGAGKIKELKKSLLIPARALMEVGKILGDSEQKKQLGLTLTPKSNQVIFVTPECEVVSRLIEGEFPDFEKILPEKGNTKIVVETEGLRRGVRIASIFARESANIVKFKVQSLSQKGGQAKLKVSANAAQVGSNISEIEAKVEGKGGKIAFNSRYLLDFLASVVTDMVELEMTGGLKPGVFTPAGDKSYTHIIMPVRVQE